MIGLCRVCLSTPLESRCAASTSYNASKNAITIGVMRVRVAAAGKRLQAIVTFIRPDQQHTMDRSCRRLSAKLRSQALRTEPELPHRILRRSGRHAVYRGRRHQQSADAHLWPPRRRQHASRFTRGARACRSSTRSFRIYGPVGGIAATNGKVFISHRDANDMGMITAFGYDGTHSTVVSGFPRTRRIRHHRHRDPARQRPALFRCRAGDQQRHRRDR